MRTQKWAQTHAEPVAGGPPGCTYPSAEPHPSGERAARCTLAAQRRHPLRGEGREVYGCGAPARIP